MAKRTLGAAVSHVGKVRSNNQDSGFAGAQLFVVADGMGGHAGGDVASAIAVNRIAETDNQYYASPQDAEFALQSALVAANQLLAETVFEHPELTGMGTTVSALIRVGDSMAIAHIGDSRIYLLREGELSQVTADHTFVQRLVDSGRITPEEAAVHPRRSVLMRVLGDIDAAPEIDTSILGTAPGDRWMLCSDGLSSYVTEERIHQIMSEGGSPSEVADRLVKEALDHGAPDNVTVIIADIDPADAPAEPDVAVTVGAAASPLEFDPEAGRRLRLPSLLLHPIKTTSVARETHLEADADDYLDTLIAEDRKRASRRRLTWLISISLVILAVVIAAILGYQWTQTRYYVGVNDDRVAIYQGVQQTIGPIPLSSVFQNTDVLVEDLPSFYKSRVERTINAESVTDAFAIVTNLERNLLPGSGE
ncbi:Stp1/IreP family PP2C-type Ser/Thr phosphatase [Amnibacterium flavum]|uniref:Stp1/IreP family PP2C-type Ser/Thr phosphatase n=1 Tax=Amnibacterium flavum TaxID=2173173 RepID=A0A2V1HT36_9MICO|nr:Stp1/IreP family PP2C-type Ser/Thr phosphatase [Amnibacterium flavum]PVZ95501.1 Stp1/IreP family PP2C-type Ser/Thr phosphatase [Amnibacterium flavum]